MGRDANAPGIYTRSGTFQSTRPHGARHHPLRPQDAHLHVSIHAPAWGATLSIKQRALNIWGFNPRARMGRDADLRVAVEHDVEFQSTRPHGARHGEIVNLFRVVRFQSTRPHGARHPQTVVPQQQVMFQSTRPHGARRIGVSAYRSIGASFNPRARMGRDNNNAVYGCVIKGFNPRARMGRDHRWLMRADRGVWFQSTRPHGARRETVWFDADEFVFQSTRPHGARRTDSTARSPHG